MPMNTFEYPDIATFVVVFLALLAVVVLVVNAKKAVEDLFRPVTDLHDEIDKINDRLDRVDEKLLHDYETMLHEKELDRLLLRSVRQLIIHEIDGNDTGSLKKLEGDIEQFLIDNA